MNSVEPGAYNPPIGRGGVGRETTMFGKEKYHPSYSLFDDFASSMRRSDHSDRQPFIIEAHAGLAGMGVLRLHIGL